ncbi:site-specific DNA-methyltransferase (plasmid) [Ralstonia syzygii subsp. celebesensis]|uniref:Methyltransferase n=3 Tax=Ralstonia syzygii TaxID=28097 RepID=A0A1U9VDA7_9RALS|nr:site-specific DNA-methyltransferase [Ralstonia syzygii]AQW28652.1 DNA modification methylase [blood disease bacterium A2-HR MARDI]CCA82219.1 putative dna modification methylase protein [blood disease bacterium R229]
MRDLSIQTRPVEALIPYARNSRTHSAGQVAQIAASIREFGWTNPVLVDGENGIIAGHGRVLAARKLGLTEVPCIEIRDMTEAQKRAYVIADNKLAENAGWDKELLALELGELKADGFDLDLIGFDAEDLGKLLEPDAKIGLTDDDDAPEVAAVAVSCPGDLWVLGSHRVMCGDSTSVADVERLMDGYKADLIVTDPPYNVAYEGGTAEKLTIQNDSMGDEAFYQFLLAAYGAMFAVAKDGAGLYVFHADSEGVNFRKAMTDAGFKLAQCCVWVKQSLVLGRQDYHWQHEPVLYGWKATGAHRWYSDRKQSTVWNFDRPARNDVHPTMKPVALIEYPLCNSSRGGDVVLDLFGGSGTTLIACEKHSRSARLMELDPKYCDVIIRRWQEFTGQQATLAGDGRAFAQVAEERMETTNARSEG